MGISKKYLKTRLVLLLLISSYLLLITANHFHFVEFLPSCPIKSISGLECYGCGLNRSLLALLSGNIEQSFHYHKLGWLLACLMSFTLFFDYTYYHKNLIKDGTSH